MYKRLSPLIIVTVLVVALFCGCASTAPAVTSTPDITATVEITPAPTATPEPTPTKEPFHFNPCALPQYGVDFLGDQYDDWCRMMEALYAGNTEVQLENISTIEEFDHLGRGIGIFFTPFQLLYDHKFTDDGGPFVFDPKTKVVTIRYASEKEEYLKKIKEYTDKVEWIFNEHVTDISDTFETAKELFLYTSNSIDFELNLEFTGYDTLMIDKGICLTKSKVYRLLLWQVDIEAYLMFNEKHAWNVVVIDGEPYYMDTTWHEDGYPLYYFAMSDKRCFEDTGHRVNSSCMDILLRYEKFSCTSTKYDDYWKDHR